MAIKNTTAGGRTLKLLGVGARTLGRSLIKNLPVGGDKSERSLRYWTDVGADMVKTLGDLRGAAMKLGQLASQYSDVLPPALAQQLKLLQRSVTPLPFAEIEPLLQAQWTAKQRKAVRHIEPVAMAAASIGQVHRAVLGSGEAVVIKVRYPGVREAVDADLSQLRRLITASKLLPVDGHAMDRLMAEVKERFREETDYAAELVHLQHLRAAAVLPGIVYATPHTTLCTDGILVMSEESGETLDTATTWAPALRDQIGSTLCGWIAHSMFTARAVHADPHPGNFAFRPNGSVVVYDMGCVKNVPSAVVEQLRGLLNAGIRSDWQGVHDALIALQGVPASMPLATVQELYADFTQLIVHRLLAAPTFDFGESGFIEDVRKAGRKHLLQSFKFQPVSDLIFVMRALSGLYWMLRSLNAVVPVRQLLAAHGIAESDQITIANSAA